VRRAQRDAETSCMRMNGAATAEGAPPSPVRLAVYKRSTLRRAQQTDRRNSLGARRRVGAAECGPRLRCRRQRGERRIEARRGQAAGEALRAAPWRLPVGAPNKGGSRSSVTQASSPGWGGAKLAVARSLLAARCSAAWLLGCGARTS